MNNYHELVEQFARTLKNGQSIPRGNAEPKPHLEIAPDAPTVLIFSPHPDDEVIIGGLPLRMMRQSGMRIINVAVTQGSDPDRQKARLEELKNCCSHIGFELVTTKPSTGLEGVNLETRESDPDHWASCVETISKILTEYSPNSIFLPHKDDWNSTHIGTHYLVTDALSKLPLNYSCHAFETEFWGAMSSPNLMVESSGEELGDLLTALSFHIGEVRRNPYHLLTPAWMIDNVRRGAELVGGQGGDAPNFAYATLYRQRLWSNGGFVEAKANSILSAKENPADLF